MIDPLKRELNAMTMSIKQKFENHPLVFGVGLIGLGFGAGWTVHETLDHYTLSTTTIGGVINCHIDGIDLVENAHHERVKILYGELAKMEENASDHNLIRPYQKDYKEAADRIRKDIDIANSTYQNAVQSLKKMCE